MVERNAVVWAPDPFKADSGNPRPWLVVATDRLPYPDEESIAVALSTQSHHHGSIAVPSDAWLRGQPDRRSHVLPWTVATLKNDLHVVGVQGSLADDFVDRVRTTVSSYLEPTDS